jgi:hypothetical protein
MMAMTPVTRIMKDLLKMGKENLTAVARELDSRAVFIERSSLWGKIVCVRKMYRKLKIRQQEVYSHEAVMQRNLRIFDPEKCTTPWTKATQI